MEKHFIDIQSICTSYLIHESIEWHQLNFLVSQLKDIMQQDTEREKVSEDSLNILTELLQTCKTCIDEAVSIKDSIECITQSYRLLRNVCVQCKRNQDLIHCHEKLFLLSNNLIDIFINLAKSKENELPIITLRCMVQFLGNCTTGHRDNQLLLWRTSKKNIRKLLTVADDKLVTYTCMVVHTCLSNNCDNSEIWANEDTIQVVVDVIAYTAVQECEWGMFLIESLCKVDQSFSLVLPRLEDSEKLLTLEILLDQVKHTEKDHITAMSNLQYIKTDVKTQAYKLLSLLTKHEDQNPVVIVKEIEILGIATSHHTVYQDINEDKDLLTCIIYLLDAIHKMGKQGDNVFSSVNKSTDVVHVDTDHATYGLKRDLIRLIGNMAYQHEENQNLIREMNCIPLVLDQTNIDGRNPYITQWSVLAIHNICKDNAENKAVLASLKFSGLVDDAETLRKYGIDAEVKDDKIVVKAPTTNK